jgi:hypothetical protein
MANYKGRAKIEGRAGTRTERIGNATEPMIEAFRRRVREEARANGAGASVDIEIVKMGQDFKRIK